MSSRVPLPPSPHPPHPRPGHYLIYVNDIVLEERSPVGGVIPPRQAGEQAAVGVCGGAPHRASLPAPGTAGAKVAAPSGALGSLLPHSPIPRASLRSPFRAAGLLLSPALPQCFRAKLVPLRPSHIQVPDGGSRPRCAGSWCENQNFHILV